MCSDLTNLIYTLKFINTIKDFKMHLDKNDFNVYMFTKLGLVYAIFLLLPLKFAVLTLIIIAASY